MLLCLGREKIPPSLTTVELGVKLHCEGCERRIREKLYKMRGVDAVDVDTRLQKVTVSGYVEPRKVLKRVKRMGATAEYWPFRSHRGNYAYIRNYEQPTQVVSYSRANYYATRDYVEDNVTNRNMAGSGPSFPISTVKSTRMIGDGAASMFSDDNVHACSVM